ncbi:MAG: hypothetical protein EBS25_02370 [Actinobacteria bacterium]|nr:hypothetical protein [Actinomycetota bacterium]
MSTETVKKTIVGGPGLKKQGVVFLQSLLIFVFVSLEILIRSGAGSISGVVLLLVTYGGVNYGRRYVAAVTPPIAYAATTLVMTIFTDGIRISRVGIDFIASLASVAPFLLISALYAWFMFFNERAKSRPSKRRVEA